MEERSTLGLLLAVAPGEERGERLLARALSAAQGGEEVLLYLLDEGVLHLDRSEIDELAAAGARVYCCAYGAQRRGIDPSRRAVFSGLYVLASLVAGCDRFESAA